MSECECESVSHPVWKENGVAKPTIVVVFVSLEFRYLKAKLPKTLTRKTWGIKRKCVPVYGYISRSL